MELPYCVVDKDDTNANTYSLHSHNLSFNLSAQISSGSLWSSLIFYPGTSGSKMFLNFMLHCVHQPERWGLTHVPQKILHISISTATAPCSPIQSPFNLNIWQFTKHPTQKAVQPVNTVDLAVRIMNDARTITM